MDGAWAGAGAAVPSTSLEVASDAVEVAEGSFLLNEGMRLESI